MSQLIAYDEQSGEGTNTSGGWQDTGCRITGASLPANTDLLVVARGILGGASASDRSAMRVSIADYSTAALYGCIIEPSTSYGGNNGYAFFQVWRFTSDSSPGDIDIQTRDYIGTTYYEQLSLTVIDLTDITVYDDWDVKTGSALNTSLQTASWINGSNLGTDEWLVLGWVNIGIGSTTTGYEAQLRTAVDASSQSVVGQTFCDGEDTAETRTVPFIGRHKASSGTPHATIYCRAESSSTHTFEGSYLIAIKTSDFEDGLEWAYDGSTDDIPTSESTDLSKSFTPTTSGNHLVLGRVSSYDTYASYPIYLHAENSGGTVLYPGDDGVRSAMWWANTDHDHNIYALVQSFSGAQTINQRWRTTSGGQAAAYRWLLIMSLKKALIEKSGSSTASVDASAEASGDPGYEGSSESGADASAEASGTPGYQGSSEAGPVANAEGAGEAIKAGSATATVNATTESLVSVGHQGSSEAGATAGTEQAGVKGGANEATAVVAVVTEGLGAKARSGSAVATVTVSSEASGSAGASGGATPIITAAAEGSAWETTRSGSSTAVVVATAEGEQQTGRSGSATASAALSVEASGQPGYQGSSDAGATLVSSEGDGDAGYQDSSESDIVVSADGDGATARTGGSTTSITVTPEDDGRPGHQGGSDTTVLASAEGEGVGAPVGGSTVMLAVYTYSQGETARWGSATAAATVATSSAGAPGAAGGQVSSVSASAEGTEWDTNKAGGTFADVLAEPTLPTWLTGRLGENESIVTVVPEGIGASTALEGASTSLVNLWSFGDGTIGTSGSAVSVLEVIVDGAGEQGDARVPTHYWTSWAEDSIEGQHHPAEVVWDGWDGDAITGRHRPVDVESEYHSPTLEV